MRRAAMVVLGICFAVVAFGKPRPSEPPPATTEAPQVHNNSSSLFAPRISTTSPDTVFFGGTIWAPDSMHWEALRDSVWTFETGVGSWINTGQLPGKPFGYHGGMEGWSGFNPRLKVGRFARSETCAISGAYSLWAGFDSVAAATRCYATGQGYGNGWSLSRSKSFIYPGSGDITLSYDYRVEAEPSFDYGYVLVDTTGDGSAPEVVLTSHTGLVAGHATLHLRRAEGTLPSTAGGITIRFLVESDGGYSDEDGMFATACGHTALDNIVLSGAVSDFSDFESGDNDWVPDPEPLPGAGDLSNLAALANLPPMQVPGPCAVADSVLVFHNQSFDLEYGETLALSPWIDLRRNASAGRPGKLVAFDLYTNYEWQPNGAVLFVEAMVRSTSGPRCGGPQNVSRFFSIPWCSANSPVLLDVSNLVAVEADQLQIGIGVSFIPGLGNQHFESPRLDNVRFGVYGMPTSGIPEVLERPTTALTGAEPNPMHSSTRIGFTISSDRHVLLEVFDVAGRLVRTLVNSPLPVGPNTAMWDARDNSGRRVPTGLYFYRLTAGNFTAASKLIVLR